MSKGDPVKKNVPDVLNLEFEYESGSNMRKITFGHLGLPFGHQGLPFGHQGLAFGHHGLPFSHQGLPIGHQGLPSTLK